MAELFHRIRRFAHLYSAGLIGAGYTVSVGLRRRENRALLRRLAESVFGEHFGRPACLLPSVSVESLGECEVPVKLSFPLGIDGNVSLLELLVLARTAAARNVESLFEFGTFDGRTTVNLIANATRDATIWTVDLPMSEAGRTRFSIDRQEQAYVDKPQVGVRYLKTPYRSRVKQVLSDSASVDYSSFRGEMDLVFVDASHAYDYVRHDSLRAMDIVRQNGGVIFWHDYSCWDGVTQALNELYATDDRFRGLRWIEGTTLAFLDTAMGQDSRSAQLASA